MSTPNARWAELINMIVHHPDTPSLRRDRAHLSRGLSKTTEAWAVPYVAPYMENIDNTRERTALLRAAAIAATFGTTGSRSFIPHGTTAKANLGRWVYEVQRISQNSSILLDPTDPDPLAARLLILPNQDLEAATQTVRRLLTAGFGRLNGKPAPTLNYLELTRMFLRWGNGLSEQSKQIRTRPMYEFYSSFEPQSRTTDLKSSDSADTITSNK